MDPSLIPYLSSFAILQHPGMSQMKIKNLTDGLASEIAKDNDDQVEDALLYLLSALSVEAADPSLVDLINDIFPVSEIE